MKEVNLHCLANSKQLLGVYSGLEEDFLDSAGMDVDTLGEPFVGVTLPTQFLPDYLTDVDLHKKNRELFVGLEVLDYLPTKQESSRSPRAICFNASWCKNLSRIRAARYKHNRYIMSFLLFYYFSIYFIFSSLFNSYHSGSCCKYKKSF